MNTPPVIERTPNFLVNWNEEIRIKDTKNGNANVAIMAPRVGSGLNLKYSVFENGKDSM